MQNFQATWFQNWAAAGCFSLTTFPFRVLFLWINLETLQSTFIVIFSGSSSCMMSHKIQYQASAENHRTLFTRISFGCNLQKTLKSNPSHLSYRAGLVLVVLVHVCGWPPAFRTRKTSWQQWALFMVYLIITKWHTSAGSLHVWSPSWRRVGFCCRF